VIAGDAAIPVAVVVISSNGEGDRSVESLEVKVPEGWAKDRLKMLRNTLPITVVVFGIAATTDLSMAINLREQDRHS
jgi:hypothetical protein